MMVGKHHGDERAHAPVLSRVSLVDLLQLVPAWTAGYVAACAAWTAGYVAACARV